MRSPQTHLPSLAVVVLLAEKMATLMAWIWGCGEAYPQGYYDANSSRCAPPDAAVFLVMHVHHAFEVHVFCYILNDSSKVSQVGVRQMKSVLITGGEERFL